MMLAGFTTSINLLANLIVLQRQYCRSHSLQNYGLIWFFVVRENRGYYVAYWNKITQVEQ